jgi:hypothetical protein
MDSELDTRSLEALINDAVDEAPLRSPERQVRSFDQLIGQLRVHARKLKWHRKRLQVGIDELKQLTVELHNELIGINEG